MKKVPFSVLLPIVFLFCISVLRAQSGIGLTAGMNYSFVKEVNGAPADIDLEAGPALGVFYQLQVGEKWRLVPEYQFAYKGYTVQPDATSEQSRIKLAYLDFLPQAEYRLNRFLGLDGGVNIAYKVNEKVKQSGSGWETPLVNNTSDWDFGVLGGLKIYLNRLHFKIRYCHGLANTSPFGPQQLEGGETIAYQKFNRNLQLSAGYRLTGR